MRKRVPIYLDEHLYDELVKRARNEYRDPRDEATLIVVNELKKSSLKLVEDPKPKREAAHVAA